MKYIIFDLEATCWSEEDKNNDRLKHKYKQNEIIEIGAIMLDENLNIIGEFDEFVKPTINPILSDFCKELTHIKQEDVDKANTLNTVMSKFEKWCGNDCYLCSWGFYDKKQIKKEIKLKYYRGNIEKLLQNHISIKHQFGDIKKIRPCGTQKALNMLKLKFEGTQHRAIDDVRNITKIFISVFNKLKF